ncbi:estradiol 17-beta-dehydrogenase 2 isoform X2 [Callorhinchus milii]|uniref:estradiol 17-beta-dehydrogenase 2 isoform X2 n=1 Tax=Callorhinchus milii TaxID=7868 RepID=UPI0004571677|nr:estradiol 17-beta-dehydrogenase 2 isoform X2 [Callorhinchus milii]|eukprot:gi/632986813/ref/XP_007910444.1/ PREDICTED: estradiol 17-beta-dehydrogenase 2-like isoform X2 [Callorhinchus milii]
MDDHSTFILVLYGLINSAFAAALVNSFRKSDTQLNLSSSCVTLMLLFCGELFFYLYFSSYVGLVVFILCSLLAYVSIRSKAMLSPGGKTVLITGCDSGFGHTLAKHLDSLGVYVFATVLDEEGDGAQELKAVGSDRLIVFQMDVTNHAMIQETKEKVKKQLGGKGLFALVNNAGIIVHIGDSEIIPTDAYKRCMEVNFLGAVEVTKAFLPLIRQTKGRIVNISSPSGEIPFGRMSTYGSSKAALELYSDILRQEMKIWGVKVSIIQPGATKTAQVGNVNFWCQQQKQLTDSLSLELLRDYGEDYLAEIYQKVTLLGSNFHQTMDPIIDTIVAALLTENPKSRYTTEFVIDLIKVLLLGVQGMERE